MHALIPLALAILSVVGPNGLGVSRSLRTTTDAVPVEALADTAAGLWVVYHGQDDLAMAFFSPPSIPPGEPEPAGASNDGAPDLSLFLLASSGGFERVLPGLDVPRLFLYAPYYRPQGEGRSVAEMPLDVAEYLFNALLEAHLWEHRDELPVAIEERARRAMDRLPEEHRREAYLAAVADFGSQALSVALELRRSAERLRAAGKDPCPAVRHPATLFGSWAKLFNDQEFRGRYTKDGRQAHAPQALTAADKRLFVRAVLRSGWTGDVDADFDLGCR